MQMVRNWLEQYYSKQEVWTLFLISAFPLHVWALILFFWDFSWIEQRSGTWNAIGVGAYALVIALVESVIVLLIALLLGFLIPKVWSPKERTNVLALIILLISFWAILEQLYFIRAPSLTWLISPLATFSRPLFILYLVVGGIVVISLVIPIWFVLNSDRFRKGFDTVLERVSVLTIIYLLLDVIAIIVVAWRNNFWLPL
jgi:hypothetical protein